MLERQVFEMSYEHARLFHCSVVRFGFNQFCPVSDPFVVVVQLHGDTKVHCIFHCPLISEPKVHILFTKLLFSYIINYVPNLVHLCDLGELMSVYSLFSKAQSWRDGGARGGYCATFF